MLSGAYRWDFADGLGMLLRCGLRAWMERTAEQSPSDAAPSPPLVSPLPLEPIHLRLGSMIAEMIMPSLQEVAT